MKIPLKSKPLETLISLADSGTWGDESTPKAGAPVLRSTNIYKKSMVYDDVAWRVIPQNDLLRKRLTTNDIIVTKSSGSPDHVGKCAVFEQPSSDDRPYYFSNFMLRLRSDPTKLNHRWLYYWLSSSIGRQAIAGLNNTTSGLRNLSIPQYLRQPIPIPFPEEPSRSVSEQARIVGILEGADELRRKQSLVMEESHKLVRSAFSKMFGNPARNDKGWPVITVQEAGEVKLGRQRSPEYQTGRFTKPYLRVANVYEDSLDLDDVLSMDFDERDFRQFCLAPYDILLNEGQSTELVGRPAMYLGEIPECCFQNTLIRFRAYSPKCTPEYSLAVFLNYLNEGRFARVSTKTSSVAHLGASRFAVMPFPLPPLSLQLEYSEFRRATRNLQSKLQAQCSESDKLFASITERAFRGAL